MARPIDVRPTTTMPKHPQRVRIEAVKPQVDDGRYAAKRVVGDRVVVEVDLVADGHDAVGGVVHFRHETDKRWLESPLSSLGNDRWRASFTVDRIGRWFYTVEGWIDEFATWRHGFARKVEAGQDVTVELSIGARLVEAARARASEEDARLLQSGYESMQSDTRDLAERTDAALGPELARAMSRWPDRQRGTKLDKELPLVVDPVLARFSSWYEFFPRSTGPDGRPGTFADATRMLDYVAKLGFDIVYLPPIHPIGRSHRKGRNNTLQADPEDPGSPWAIGAAEGGHTAIHPALGSFQDFEDFRAAAQRLGLEVALDIAFQCSPDHPWVQEHPEWFRKRPDGSIQYAENPPKKYQDIYPLDFDSSDWRGLWQGLLDVFLFWIDRGVHIFRVDNPHTKSLQFWEWCISTIKSSHPDVLFLSEAFTRPKLMYALAKVGFSQSYTYFTWRNSSWEFREYMLELTTTEVAEFFRPNFWPNTPDILPLHLQSGLRSAFVARLVLASTLSSNYGIYGPAFELMEHVPRPGSEEYINNEKYELRRWDLDAPNSLHALITRINRIRRTNPALQRMEHLVVHGSENDQLFAFSKRDPIHDNAILVVVNMDYHHTQSGWINLNSAGLGLTETDKFEVHDLISDERYQWQGNRAFVKLDPSVMPAHVFRVTRGSGAG